MSVADAFHYFYDQLRVIEQGEVRGDRLAVVILAAKVLAQILEVMGLTAPKQM